MRSKIANRILEEAPEDLKIFAHWYAELSIRIGQILEDKKISQKELADRLDKKPSEISKWLNGEHNFTLRSLAKLQAELKMTLLNIEGVKEIEDVNKFSTPVLRLIKPEPIEPDVKYDTIKHTIYSKENTHVNEAI